MTLPIDIYVRVSDKGGRDGDSYQSPTDQVEQTVARVRQRGHEPGRIVVDEDVGGGKRVKDRRLEELVVRVERGESAGIASFNVKRFARSVAEGSAAIKRIKDADGEFFDSYGNSTRENSLAINIYLAIGEDELEKLTEQWERSRTRSIGLGKFVGPTPFGYVKVDGRLFEHDVEGPIVREVYRRIARGKLEDGIAHLAEKAPTRTRRRKGKTETYAVAWNTDNVRKLVLSRTYRGEHGARGGVDYPGHVALATEPIWQAVKSKLDDAKRPRRRNGDYLLSGLVECSCGAPLVGQLQPVNGRPDGEPSPRYRCAVYGTGRGVHSSCKADDLVDYVRGEVATFLADDDVRADLMPEGLDAAAQRFEEAQDELAAYLETASARNRELFARGQARREREVDDAGAEYRRLVAEAESFEVLPLAHEVERDDEKLTAALRTAAARGLTLALRRGRGPVADRIVWRKHGKDVPGSLAA